MQPLKPDFAPYAPAANVLSVINRLRQRGLPDPLDIEQLITVGIPDGNASRVLQALNFLGLIDIEGHLTPAFKEIGKAPDDVYHELLSGLIQAAYNLVFVSYDPATATMQEMRNAFRRYEPRAQNDRMITFFTAMCRECGIIQEDAKPARSVNTKTTVQRKKPVTASSSNNHSAAQSANGSQGNLFLDSPAPMPPTSQEGHHSQKYRLLSILLEELPGDDNAEDFDRDAWLQAFTTTLNFLLRKKPDTGMSRKGSSAQFSAELPSTILD